jgi:hypothetical protein
MSIADNIMSQHYTDFSVFVENVKVKCTGQSADSHMPGYTDCTRQVYTFADGSRMTINVTTD